MTAVIVGLAMVALSPVSGVQILGVIVALFGAGWLWLARTEPTEHVCPVDPDPIMLWPYWDVYGNLAYTPCEKCSRTLNHRLSVDA